MTKTTKYPGFTEEQQPIMEFIEDMAFTLLRHRSDGSVYFLTRILLAIRTSADAYQQFYQIEIPGGWLHKQSHQGSVPPVQPGLRLAEGEAALVRCHLSNLRRGAAHDRLVPEERTLVPVRS